MAYEGSHTDGPFQNPLRYTRHNVTGNFTQRLSPHRALGFKFNVGLNRARANAHVTNGAGYVQESVSLLDHRLQLGGGLRMDAFRFNVDDRAAPELGGTQSAQVAQPKLSLAFTPTHRLPVTLYA